MRSRVNRSSTYKKKNYGEDALVEAIDNKRVILRYADWIEKLRNSQVGVTEFLHAVSPDVVVELLNLALHSDSEKVRVEASKDLLDRAGHSKVNKVALASVDPNTPKDQLIALIEGLSKKNGLLEVEE